MSRRIRCSIMVVLAAIAAAVGFWAFSAPASFFASFPAWGRHWVAVDGPYNEHLVRDVGALYLALLVVTVSAAVHADAVVTRVAGLAWLAFSVPHLAYHGAHLDLYGPTDRILVAVALGGTALLAALLCLPQRRRAAAPPPRAALPTKGGA